MLDLPPGNSLFYWYGVPNGSLHLNLNNGTSIYPSYNFGSYRSVNPAPIYNSFSYYGATWNRRGLGWRRGWRR